MGEVGGVGANHLCDTGDGRRILRERGGVITYYQDMHGQLPILCGRDRLASRLLELMAVVFGEYQYAHHSTLASRRSFSTSSLTLSTLMPDERGGGTVSLSCVRRGPASTPRSAAVMVWIGFFFDIIKMGRFTSRG